MDNRVWVNRYQPQTLYIAQLLMYFQGILALVFGVLGARFLSLVVLGVAVGKVMAAFGIANERRWGYKLGVVVAVLPFLALFLRVVDSGLGRLRADMFGLLFDIALLALLLHPISRSYQQHWPKSRRR